MSPPSTGKLADPDWRAERARKAAAARTSLDHHLTKLVESAPSLTPEQLDRIRGLLPAREVADDGPVA